MATATDQAATEQQATATTPPDEAAKTYAQRLEDVAIQELQLMVAEKAMMLDKIGKQNSQVLRLAEAAAGGDFTKLASQAATDSAGDDNMGVSIGNAIHYHMATAQNSATNTSPGAPAAPVASAGGGSVAPGTWPTWLKVGLAGLALAGSGGAGAAITSLLSNATTVTQQPTNDTDTNAGLRFKTGV